MIGKTISNYKVTSELGKGGMGEVWRAQDTKLGRDVALKVLPESFAQDPERLERFEREARVLASLSHPHIAGIFGFEDVDGKRFLVMEVAEGETLSERIARGPVPVADAVKIAAQIAEALEVAHEKGIVHRDLKPGNVMVTDEGQVKVLDFGLAKAMGIHPLSGSSGQDWTQSPTLAPGGTQAGMLLGTAGYMSPEQARGKPVDRRSDIWAFGCVLFEMLGGRKAFDGETVTDVLGAIVHKDPELDKLPADVPRRIKDLIGRCLQKDQSRRLQSIGDARIALEEWLENPLADTAAGGATVPATGWTRWLPWAAAVVAAAVAFGIGWLLRPAEERPQVRFQVAAPEGLTVMGSPRLSPDGRLLAFDATDSSGTSQIWIRPLEAVEALPVAGSEGAGRPFWSPDSRFLGFFAEGKLKKVAASGGPPQSLCDVSFGADASWGSGGVILFDGRTSDPLRRCPAAGGVARPEVEPNPEAGINGAGWPEFLPDGRHFLYVAIRAAEEPMLYVRELDSGEETPLFETASRVQYAPPGYLLYVREDTLVAQPFDADAAKAHRGGGPRGRRAGDGRGGTRPLLGLLRRDPGLPGGRDAHPSAPLGGPGGQGAGDGRGNRGVRRRVALPGREPAGLRHARGGNGEPGPVDPRPGARGDVALHLRPGHRLGSGLVAGRPDDRVHVGPGGRGRGPLPKAGLGHGRGGGPPGQRRGEIRRRLVAGRTLPRVHQPRPGDAVGHLGPAHGRRGRALPGGEDPLPRGRRQPLPRRDPPGLRVQRVGAERGLRAGVPRAPEQVAGFRRGAEATPTGAPTGGRSSTAPPTPGSCRSRWRRRIPSPRAPPPPSSRPACSRRWCGASTGRPTTGSASSPWPRWAGTRSSPPPWCSTGPPGWGTEGLSGPETPTPRKR